MPIEFDTDLKNRSMPIYTNRAPSGLVGWLIRKGLVKDEARAKMLMIGVVIANVALSGVVVMMFL